MVENNLKKLSRTELLEMLIDQTKENEALTERNLALENQVAELRQKLEDRKIDLETAGSIAEASLRLNRVFEAAQAAADEYINTVKEKYEHQMQYAQASENETQAKVDQMLRQAQEQCRRLETETAEKCEKMTEQAQKASRAYWDQVSSKLNEYMKQRADLRDLIASNRRSD